MLGPPSIYLLRHGEIVAGEQKCLIGRTDTPLSARGREQALRWRDQWASISFARIYCSDLQRSRRTAELVAGERLSLIEIIPELREINLGQWEGLPVDEVKRRFPDEWHKRGLDIAGYGPPAGESFSDLYARVIPLFNRITARLEQDILIVGHSAVNRTILCRVLEIPLKNVLRIGQDYGALTIIESTEQGLRVRTMNCGPGRA